MRTKRIILVQGTQPEGLVGWSSLWRTDQNFQRYTGEAQSMCQNPEFELVRFCKEGPDSFSPEQRTGIAQLLTFNAAWAQWQDLLPELCGTKQWRRRIPNTLFVGHSFGTWIAAGLLGFWGGFHETFRAIETRATHTCPIRGASTIIQADPRQEPELDLVLLERVCERTQTSLGVINTPWQAVASGTEEGIQELQKMLSALKMRSRNFPLGVPWHNPTLMANTRRKLRQTLRGMQTQTLRAPLGYLDHRGKLRRTRSPRVIPQVLLQELTEQLNFWLLASQLPKTAELIELSVHGRLFLTKFVEEARAAQTCLQKAPAPILQES